MDSLSFERVRVAGIAGLLRELAAELPRDRGDVVLNLAGSKVLGSPVALLDQLLAGGVLCPKVVHGSIKSAADGLAASAALLDEVAAVVAENPGEVRTVPVGVGQMAKHLVERRVFAPNGGGA